MSGREAIALNLRNDALRKEIAEIASRLDSQSANLRAKERELIDIEKRMQARLAAFEAELATMRKAFLEIRRTQHETIEAMGRGASPPTPGMADESRSGIPAPRV